MPDGLRVSSTIYRNSDKAWNDVMSRETARRTIPLSMTLRAVSSRVIALDLKDLRGCAATSSVVTDQPLQQAHTPQGQQRQRVLEKLGDTHFHLDTLDDRVDYSLFIPASILASLRRNAITALETSWHAKRPTEKRRPHKKHHTPFLKVLKSHTATMWPTGSPRTFTARTARHQFKKL